MRPPEKRRAPSGAPFDETHAPESVTEKSPGQGKRSTRRGVLTDTPANAGVRALVTLLNGGTVFAVHAGHGDAAIEAVIDAFRAEGVEVITHTYLRRAVRPGCVDRLTTHRLAVLQSPTHGGPDHAA